MQIASSLVFFSTLFVSTYAIILENLFSEFLPVDIGVVIQFLTFEELLKYVLRCPAHLHLRVCEASGFHVLSNAYYCMCGIQWTVTILVAMGCTYLKFGCVLIQYLMLSNFHAQFAMQMSTEGL